MKPLVYKKSRRVRGTEPKRHKMHIAKGDTVRVISGEDRGKEGRVLHVYPKKDRVVVEGVNVVKKHKRATTPQGESGIIDELTRQFEKALILRALAHTGGRRIEAANLLGLGRNTLTRKIQELKLDTEKQ